ncbi:hypothetical protein GQ43DRAFT_197906 [Delitschia confertaspora ATCC 74209]|uniref:PWWP domain-containing protein n=1 Tax=Delitschia confertaspora ATCC 74209 TaxID=1513339 RepID=A0A9P4MV06_9PLEO|nr:hypothetical protein GQ43DRAFT_197906 [Delitschia confertaspora ATCC 74209]
MADEANPPVAADASKAPEDTTRVEEAPAETASADPASVENGEATKSSEAGETGEESNPSTEAMATVDENEPSAAEPKAEDTTIVGDDIVPEPQVNGTPAPKKGNNKRKSISGIPEHKKKTPSKKKAAPELHLNVQPGEYWFVAMRGFPPWPVVVCDEEMLPETLLSKRPVSAKRIDGTYREDFREGGKNAKDRRYPIMFLGTNEFAWQVNTDLQPLDVEQVKREVEEGKPGKKTRALWEAYKVAAEGHDLPWFKMMLEQHEQAMNAEVEAPEADTKKPEKKGKRKSVVAEEVDAEDMEIDIEEDGAPAKKTKASKKRKAETDDDEVEKPAKKTPKTKLKLNNKAAKEASAVKPKKETKAKTTKAKSASEETEAAKSEEKQMTPAERLEKREKSVLYLRHRLQKGFLTRDQAPKEEEMANMSDYFRQLEAYTDLEAEVIKKTKVHKVLKAIVKLNSIPKEEEHQFKKRSNDLLNNWKLALATDVGEAPPAETPAEPTTNGAKPEASEEKTDAEAPKETATEETPAESDATKPDATKPDAAEPDADGDVSMAEAKDDPPAKEADAEAPAEAEIEAPVETTA